MMRGIEKRKRLYIILGVIALSSFLVSFFTSQYNVRKNSNSAGAANLSATLTTQADWAQGELTNIDTSDNSISISDKTISWDSTTLGNLGSIDYGISSLDLGDGRGDGNNKLYFAAIDSNKIGEVWYSEGSWNSQIFAAAGSYRWYVDAKTPGKVYSGGMMGAVKHEYISGNWQNTLLASTWTPDYSGDLFVNGDDVYFVSGRDLTLEGREYKLWKNNTAIWSLAAPDASSNRIMIAGGDGRNDGTTRMYVYTQEGDIYEFSPDGSSWTANNIYDGNIIAGTLQIYLGDGRNDGINRLYFHDSSSTQLKEFSYSDGNWINTATITATHTIEKIAFGDGRNDGTNRIYYSSGSTLYEISYFPFVDGNWFERTVGSDSGASFKEIVIGDGRNDGTNRIYVANYNEDTIDEFTYTGENPAIHISASSQIDGGNEFANWGSFTSSQTVPANTSLTFRFRTSIDSINWTSWTDAQNYSDTGIDISSLVTSEQDGSYYRYLQVESTLYSIDGFSTPTLSDYTVNYTTTDAPTCSDGIQNGDETGIDCGGSCDACPPEESCSDGILNQDEEDVDCGGVCDPCPVAPTCSDGIQNGDEEGIDCGGSCDACPTCSDGIQNQDETGIDCGGSCPACEEPPEETCSDGVQNQDETGIDCGGVCPACPLICPLPNPSWCDTIECNNQIEIQSPLAGERYATGSSIDIKWLNKSSAKSLIEGWNIHYNIDISYNNGSEWNRIASAIKDANFPAQSSWQSIFADTNWQTKLKNNTYRFYIPKIESVVSDQVKIRINMYRTEANPFGCSSYAEDISKNFVIYRGQIDPVCKENQYYFSLPENTIRASTANTQYYYLTQSEVSKWPNVSFDIELKKNGQKNPIANSNLQVSPSSIAKFDNKGKLSVSSNATTPQDFSVVYYDPTCDENYILNIVAKKESNRGKITVKTPNGGEFWLIGKQYAVEWENTYEQDVISFVSLHLSVDSGKNWDWKITKDNKGTNKQEMIPVDSLSTENSYRWDIPLINELTTKEARVKISAYDKNGVFLASDTSDDNFEISNSQVGAAIDKVKNLLDDIAKALTALALIFASAILAIPHIQNAIAYSSFYEHMYGILSSGKRKKNDWGIIYDSENGFAIANALITLYDADSKRLIETTVSDKEGRYGFIAHKGRYFIKVKKQNYEIASTNIFSQQGLKYQNNYLGETINITDDEQAILANIPMRSLDSLNKNAKNVSILSIIEKYLIIFNWPLISLGTIVSVLALAYCPNLINLIILIIYIPLWIMQISRLNNVKAYGLVLESTKLEPIDLALIRIFNQENNHLIRTVASDLKGHYAVLVSKGKYNILCDKPGFTTPKIIDKVIDVGYKPLSDTIYLNKTEI
ncbi:MAG: hypothetical protein BWY19_00711 [bacterium ADurb.Bin212]|jgi:hypothetical protein|nr:MAG: hypothetical protein BWY19_00711 [bacterium ADurb.Bin212]